MEAYIKYFGNASQILARLGHFLCNVFVGNRLGYVLEGANVSKANSHKKQAAKLNKV